MDNKGALWRTILFSIFLVAIIMVMAMGEALWAEVQEKQLYTAYNIWYEPGKETNLWCINYKTGNMIPAGTKVGNVALDRARKGRILGAEEISLTFTTLSDGKQYWVNINKKFHPGKSINDYKEMMFTNKPFEEITKGLQEFEIEAITRGVVVKGMSKQGVFISYGPPPEHRTPNYMESSSWIYWMKRLKTKEIYFDENQKAAARPENSNIL